MTLVKSPKALTGQFTDLFFEEQLASAVKNAKAEISEILISLRDRKSVFTYSGQIVTAAPTDFPRLLAEWGTKSQVQQVIRNIVTSALFSAEEKCSGAALLAAGLWVTDESLNVMTKNRCTGEEVKSCLSYLGGNGMARAAAEAVIEQGGLGCRVEFEETDGPVTRVVAKRGREILGCVDPLFGDRVGRSFDLERCAVVAIDGSVESVSSIHRILETSSEIPVIVIAAQFLPDVSNTMAETWKSGRGKCLPFVVSGWGVENFLDLEKQEIFCVSAERGDTISGLKLESYRPFDVSVSGNACVVSTESVDINSKLTVEVSRSLGGLTGLAKDRVKMLVGYARQCARSGVTKWEKLSEESQRFSDLYSRDLVISSSSVAVGSRASESLKKVLQELGCVILVSQGEKK